MKNTFFCLVIIFVSAIPVDLNAQTSNEQAKQTLKTIWLAYECYNSNTVTFEPDAYIQHGNGEITGQKFLYPVPDNKYVIVTLDSSGNRAQASSYQNSYSYKIDLTWTNNVISGIATRQFDYTVDYDVNREIAGFHSEDLVNNSFRYVFKIEWSNGQPHTITRYENKTGSEKLKVRDVKTYTYSAQVTVVDILNYVSIKPNEPKNRIGRMKCVYEKNADSTFTVTGPYGATIIRRYNANDKIERKYITSNSEIEEEHAYFYRADSLFKEEVTGKMKNGDFSDRYIHIYFSLPEQPASIPDYEKTRGNYGFNAAGECVYEARDGYARIKENSVWGEWKSYITK